MTSIANCILVLSLLSISTAFTPSMLSKTPTNPEAETTTSHFSIHGDYSYDMGIGKNRPLHADLITNPTSHVEGAGTGAVAVGDRCYGEGEGGDNRKAERHDAAQFMVQYESIHKFPSPLDPELELRSAKNGTPNAHGKRRRQAGKSKQKDLPKVTPKRQLEDVLLILTDEINEDSYHQQSEAPLTTYNSNGRPVMIRQAVSRQLDINSVWVEMLIHDQQNAATTGYQRT